MAIISYVKHPQSICGEDGSKISGVCNTVYDNTEFATGIVTDYDVKANQATSFHSVTTAKFCSIRTDADITVKFNDSGNEAITISANTTFNVDTLEITNIYITAAASANVKIFLT
jgi:hypothetical protein